MVMKLAVSICLVNIISCTLSCEQGEDVDLCYVLYGKEQFQAQLANFYPVVGQGGRT